jgi:alpha-1,2-glucosyltransferase
MFHPSVPYLLIPLYIACAWAWFLRVGASRRSLGSLTDGIFPTAENYSHTSPPAGTDQTLFQTLLLPVCTLPALLPAPLLEPRYFLIPYILLRAQVPESPRWGLALEMAWYVCINASTMWVFLYREREGVGRFMW